MKNFSNTYVSVIVMFISYVLKLADVNIVNGEIEAFVLTGVQIISGCVILYERFKKGDLKWFGSRLRSQEPQQSQQQSE